MVVSRRTGGPPGGRRSFSSNFFVATIFFVGWQMLKSSLATSKSLEVTGFGIRWAELLWNAVYFFGWIGRAMCELVKSLRVVSRNLGIFGSNWRTAAISGLSAAILLAAILVVLFVYLFFDDFIFLAKLMAWSGCWILHSILDKINHIVVGTGQYF